MSEKKNSKENIRIIDGMPSQKQNTYLNYYESYVNWDRRTKLAHFKT